MVQDMDTPYPGVPVKAALDLPEEVLKRLDRLKSTQQILSEMAVEYAITFDDGLMLEQQIDELQKRLSANQAKQSDLFSQIEDFTHRLKGDVYNIVDPKKDERSVSLGEAQQRLVNHKLV